MNILFPILIGLILRLINISMPILGVHSWRQSDTAAMARHFALNNTPIWQPEIDWRGAGEGFVESEFPLFPYLVSQFYNLFGIHEVFGRGLSIAFSLLTIFLLIKIVEELFDPLSAWWSGLFFAILPLPVFYGRTFQAESLLLFLSVLSIERLIAWEKNHHNFSLVISWLSFSFSCLIKVLPFLWLGIPLAVIHLTYQLNLDDLKSNNYFNKILNRAFKSYGLWIFASLSLLLTFIWFYHAYSLGQTTGLTFGFWGKSSNRSSISLLFDFRIWVDLFIRLIVRNLGIFGLPILLLGIFHSSVSRGKYFIYSGFISMLVVTAFAIRSSSIHEYYQLPLQIFLCISMGLGMTYIKQFISNNNLNITFYFMPVAVVFICSLIILRFDYFAKEDNQLDIWYPLANRINQEAPIGSLIVSVTGMDPTLLNLSRRQGWLTAPENITQSKIEQWYLSGASHIVGSLFWLETYNKMSYKNREIILKNIICLNKDTSLCSNVNSSTYVVKIRDLID